MVAPELQSAIERRCACAARFVQTVPVSVPVVTYRPGDASLLVVGARINVVVEKRGEALVLTRVTAGRNGFVPPM